MKQTLFPFFISDFRNEIERLDKEDVGGGEGCVRGEREKVEHVLRAWNRTADIPLRHVQPQRGTGLRPVQHG